MTQFKSDDVINFWFEEIDAKLWFKKDAGFDQLITEKFSDVLDAARQAELFSWRTSAEGRLAEIIVLDQFSRNIHRDHALSFSDDGLALALAQEAINLNVADELEEKKLMFLIMPYMHSESLLIHEQAVPLFEKHAKFNLEYEIKHKSIIERFGHYPHRNDILGRQSTDEEIEFLKGPGSSF